MLPGFFFWLCCGDHELENLEQVISQKLQGVGSRYLVGIFVGGVECHGVTFISPCSSNLDL